MPSSFRSNCIMANQHPSLYRLPGRKTIPFLFRFRYSEVRKKRSRSPGVLNACSRSIVIRFTICMCDRCWVRTWGSHQVTLKRWIVIAAIRFILTHGQFPGWRGPVSTGIVNDSWGSCVGVCRPSSSFARALPLPYCLGELDRCRRMSSPRGLFISHQHDLSEREGGHDAAILVSLVSILYSVHAHTSTHPLERLLRKTYVVPFLSSAAIILSDSKTIWFVRLHDQIHRPRHNNTLKTFLEISPLWELTITTYEVLT